MIQITITADNAAELLGKTEMLAAELRRFGGAPAVTYSNTPKAEPVLVTEVKQIMAGLEPSPRAEIAPLNPAPEPGKRGRKPKAQEPVVNVEPVSTAVTSPAAPETKQPSYDEAVNAMKKYMEKDNGGIAAVRKLLMENFNVEQTKALKPEDYARVIELCNG